MSYSSWNCEKYCDDGGLVIAGENAVFYENQLIPEIPQGGFKTRIIYLSIDATLRVWMTNRKQYFAPTPFKQPIRCFTIEVVEESTNLKYPVGTIIQGISAMRTFAVYGPQDSPSVINWTPNSSIPLSAYLTVFSFTGGLTAMAGMTLPELGNLKSGDVVLVSAAAGHVGQLCCQIARAKGASKVIGIAGGNDNCEFLKRELKVDVAIDYKKGNVEAAIKEAAPNGVNLYFDNVGGEITNAAMKNMARFGRVVICGLISAYNEESGASAQLDHFENVLMDRLKISGFIVGDHQEHFPNFIQTLSEWVKNGSLALPAFEQEVGIENAIKALNRLLKGDKRPGTKMIVAVSPEPTNH